MNKNPKENINKEEVYLRLIEDSPDGFLVLNEKGYGLFSNKKAKELLQRSDDEIIDKHVGLPLYGNEDIELQLPRKDGSLRIVELRCLETTWNNNKAFLCNLRDITERRNAEEALKEHKELLEKAGELAKVGGWEVDLNKKTVYWSHTTKVIHEVPENYTPDLDNSLNYFVGPSKEQLKHALSLSILEGEPYDLILEFVTAKGNHRWVHTVGIPEMFNNKCIRLWGVIQDITDQIEAKIELEKAKEKAEESDNLKTAFLANISHEIRTPMNGILGFATLLQMSDLEGDQQKEYIDIIHQSGNRMLNIINELVDIAKIESNLTELSLKETGVDEILDDLFPSFNQETYKKGLTLKVSKPLSENGNCLYTDPVKLNQILTYLVRNAIKYTNEGHIEYGYTIKDDTFCFFVSDTGIGIGEELKEKIFERFRQAEMTISSNYEGAGLGLSISKAYVEMLGGKIWLESEIDKGTTFYFSLPIQHQNLKSEREVI